MPCSSVPPSSTTAREVPVGTSGTSTVSSSVIRTANRSMWSGRRVTGWTWTLWIEDRLGLLAVDREVDEGVRAGLAAQQVEVVGVDGDARRVEAVTEDDRREAAARRSAATFLPTMSRGSAASVGRRDGRGGGLSGVWRPQASLGRRESGNARTGGRPRRLRTSPRRPAHRPAIVMSVLRSRLP